MTKRLLTLLIICWTTYSTAQTSADSIHPIDKKCEDCLAKNTVKTTDMMQCFANSRDAWQKEMDKYYNLLLTRLKGEQKEKLIASQNSWTSYKDKEFDLSGSIYYGDDMGKEKRIDAVSRQSEIFKQRTQELKSYYDTLHGQ